MGSLRTFSREQSDGCACRASTAGTSNTMNVIFRVIGIIIIEDMSNVLNIFHRVSIRQP